MSIEAAVWSGVQFRRAYQPDALFDRCGFEAGVEAASEQSELRFVIDAGHVLEHVTEVVEHAHTDWFAGPLRFASNDDTVAGNTNYVELCLGLST